MQDLFLVLENLRRRLASEPRTRPSALRVASRVLWARVDLGMDKLARLSFLEGVAWSENKRMKPGTWVRKGRAGWKEAEKYFGKLNPAWSSNQNSGFFSAAVIGCKRRLGDADDAQRRYGRTPEEVASDFAFGYFPIAGERQPTFFEVGKTLLKPAEVEGVHEGTTTPATPGITGAIAKKFQQRAADFVRHEEGGKTKQETFRRVTPRTEMVYERQKGAPDLNPLYLELRKHHSPKAEQIRKILKKMVRRSGKRIAAEIFVAYLDYIKGAGRSGTPTGRADPEGFLADLVEITGKPKAQVSNSVKEMKKWLAENAPKMGPLFEQLKKLVSDIEILGEPGWATRRAEEEDDPEEILAEWLKIEEELLSGDRTVNVGPLAITIGDFPGAGAGAYKHALSEVIKLAYENPGEVRDALLPLIKEATSGRRA